MRVAHLSTFADHGGAARAMERIHRGLLGLGVDSTMLVAKASAARDRLRVAPTPAAEVERLRKIEMAFELAPYARSRPKGLELFSTDRSVYGPELCDALGPADVVHLHWVARFVDMVPFVQRVAATTPVVWTLHDMNLFTGGCHYDRGCERYRERCGACPQLGSTRDDDLSREVLLRKQAVLAAAPPNRLRFVAVSDWLRGSGQQSSLLAGHKVEAIHGSVDTAVFQPTDKLQAREALGLAPDANWVLFVAATPDLERKGLGELVKASVGGDWSLFTVGPLGPTSAHATADLTHLGLIRDDARLALAYSAADLTVVPSRQEAFGLIAIESMACGTPVIGHPVGGLREVIDDGRTGRLVPNGELTTAISSHFDLLAEQRATMASAARAYALDNHSLEVIASRYRNVYASLLG